ncbi:MAG: acyl dehydratase [Gammaproteobacteria bacterium]|nr:acyl dehydratase [Gammaproteobacteria bacterium]
MPTPTFDWSLPRLPAALPALRVTPTHAQIFMFSAATWNRHHIHYSRDAALAEGLPDVVVQRALIGNFFARLLSEALGDAGEVHELTWKVSASATPGTALQVHGDVVALAGDGAHREVGCELRISDADGRAVAAGTARLRLRR